jgi:hypothetical protein
MFQTQTGDNYLRVESHIHGHMYPGAWVETQEDCPECSSPDTVENANRGLIYCKGCDEEMRPGEATKAPDEFLVFSSIA